MAQAELCSDGRRNAGQVDHASAGFIHMQVPVHPTVHGRARMGVCHGAEEGGGEARWQAEDHAGAWGGEEARNALNAGPGFAPGSVSSNN